MYIAAYLEKMKIDVKIFDCLLDENTLFYTESDKIVHGVKDAYLKKIIADENPDIIGVGIPCTAHSESALKTTKLIRKIYPKIIIVAGGPHISCMRTDFLTEFKSVNYAIIGEGEIAFCHLVESIRDNKPRTDISGLLYREIENDTVVVKENKPELIKNLDDIPYPAYHLINMDHFFRRYEKGFIGRNIIGHTHSISMITSRGCPYKCVFCSIHIHMGREYRAHSANYVFEHIKYVTEKYGITHISFEDDNFNLRRTRCVDIFDKLLRAKIEIKWNTPNGIRGDILDEELLKLMKQAGCESLTIAPESGSQFTLEKIINKKLDLKKIIRTAYLCKKTGVTVWSFFIIGLPGETKKEMKKTIDFAIWLFEQYDVFPYLFSATPLIGTKLHDIVCRDGYLARPINAKNLSKANQPIKGEPMIQTLEFSPDDIKHFAQQFQNRRDMINRKKLPRILLKKILNLRIRNLKQLIIKLVNKLRLS